MRADGFRIAAVSPMVRLPRTRYLVPFAAAFGFHGAGCFLSILKVGGIVDAVGGG